MGLFEHPTCRRRFDILPCLIVLATVAACSTVRSADPSDRMAGPELTLRTGRQTRLVNNVPGDVMVVAHRGCWLASAENSIDAIQSCIDAGVDMVEVDVRLSKDGYLVLMHDETVDRTTTGKGSVPRLLLSELRELRLLVRDGSDPGAVTPEPVPLLEEVLTVFKDRVLINIDCKAEVYEDVIEVVNRTNTHSQVLLKMSAKPNDRALREAPFHGRTHFMPIIYSTMGDLEVLVPQYARYEPVAYELVFDDLQDFEAASGLLKHGSQRVWVNTMLPRYSGGLDDQLALNDPSAAWGKLIEMGVDMIQTDYPVELISYLKMRRQHNVEKSTHQQESEKKEVAAAVRIY